MSLSHRRGRCTYRCTYGSENRDRVQVVKSREQKISKFGCNEKFVYEKLESPQKKGSQSKGSTGLGDTYIGVDGLPSHWSYVKPVQKYLYTIPETAELLGLSKTTVYELKNSGQLLAVYPTTAARIPASSISAFVRNLEERERREAKARRGRFV